MSENDLNQRVIDSRDDKAKTEQLIEEYKPFIASVVQKHLGRYVEYGVDDELSIALLAFHEAIMKYDLNKGNFLSLARVTIKHRLIDYFRRENRNKPSTISIEQEREDIDNEAQDLSENQAIKDFQERQIRDLRKEEILEVKKALSAWGINFLDVAKSSPKKEGTRKSYLKAINYIIGNPDILNIMKKKKYLPVEKIAEATKIPRKTIERGRNYIVAAVIILSGDYQYLKEYIQWR